MRPLIIDNNLKDKIGKLVAYAEKHPFTIDNLQDIKKKVREVPGDMEGYVLLLPFGYKIVFSIELQPAGKVRHLSMSVDEDGKLPNPGVVGEIMKLIGFDNEMEDCTIYMEDISPVRKAINVLEVAKE